MKLSHAPIVAQAATFMAALCLHSASIAAQAAPGTWRCGNAYSDRPCHGGKVMDLTDSREAAQKEAADRSTREARTAAERMERDRIRTESAHGRRHTTLIDNAPRPAAASPAKPGGPLKKPKNPKKPQEFSAHDPGSMLKKPPKAGSKRPAKG